MKAATAHPTESATSAALDRNALAKVRKEIGSSKEKAREFLHRAGITTPKGKLRKAYR